jgi:hypothetical protein
MASQSLRSPKFLLGVTGIIPSETFDASIEFTFLEDAEADINEEDRLIDNDFRAV